jgi:serine/threonine protein kinase/WD40 repeat protein
VHLPARPDRCPDCGTELVSEPGIPGLCPQCVFSLALRQTPPSPEEVETLDRPAPGLILGERYQVRELLGRGGMGEVFRAFDLKLRVDVALKAVRTTRMEDERAREMLRREVRAAREVVSPNVCRIFDLVVEGSQELVSMEYIDGTTLAETLRERGPLGLEEAREIASQFLSGLEAIHRAGLVHRDFKPENVMVTRAGRVVVMDFGLAKAATQGQAATVSGTPAYMAPEQARGEGVDARADVFAAGVVLAEMLGAGGPGYREARQVLWGAVREVPPRVPEGPWAPVLRQSLALHPRERQASAHELARALEEVAQRLPGFEEKRPYPGLSSFTAEEAEYFFGREVEVESLWRRLKRPRLLALIGPSGAGKSSFLQAGLLATLPGTWSAVIATPGSRPFQSLAQALVSVFSGDTEATQGLLRMEDAETAVSLLRRWRRRHEHALLVVDQFEELFTLCPREVQGAFASLLGKLVLESDLHVILSLRDDFLFRLHEHESLAPAFSDLTPLGTLGESALRRALVQPALSCGYRFEDESLVDEMVGEVVKERGALPLLAFAASRLWDKRDRERGLLTREAYQEIGGVAGALAQHAESTLERIGTSRIPLVREIFRNLVTGQGTRAVPERGELLSVFEQRASAASPRVRELAGSSETPPSDRALRSRRSWSHEEAVEVLDALVDARLLTSYERAGESGESHQHVEIIHESLLTAWPRLVRWQTQEADGAVLRDQLRQAAQAWHDRGRPEDLLWSGSAFRDFSVWRERYAGAISSTEEAFAAAAARLAGRRRRRRRLATATVIVFLLAVSTAIGISRQQAVSEARRAEAAQLLALGQVHLDSYPTAALAHALKSLELADTRAGRLLALRALQTGPIATLTPVVAESELPLNAYSVPAFSPDGEWLALGSWSRVSLFHRSGEKRAVLGDFAHSDDVVDVAFSPRSDVLMANLYGDVREWSIPDLRERLSRRVEPGRNGSAAGPEGFVTLNVVDDRTVVRQWPFDGGEPRILGTVEAAFAPDNPRVPASFELPGEGSADLPLVGGRLRYAAGRRVYERSLGDLGAPPRLLAEHTDDVLSVAVSADGTRLASSDRAGGLFVRSLVPPLRAPRRISLPDGRPAGRLRLDRRGRWLAAQSPSREVLLWDLDALPGAAPVTLLRTDVRQLDEFTFTPDGEGLFTTHKFDAALWTLDGLPRALPVDYAIRGIAFTPDGGSLITNGQEVRVWPVVAGGEIEGRVLLETQSARAALALGRQKVAVPSFPDEVVVAPLAGGPPEKFDGCPRCWACAIDSEGRRVAAAPSGLTSADDRWAIRLYDLETGGMEKVRPSPEILEGAQLPFLELGFLDSHRILATALDKGLVLLDLRDGTSRLLAEQPRGAFALSADGRFVVGLTGWAEGDLERDVALVRVDLQSGVVGTLAAHGNRLTAVALDPTGTLVATGSADGTVRVGPVTGEEPHLLVRHREKVNALAFSPDGRWIASAGDDEQILLWPVPDIKEPPLQVRPYAEVLALLRSRTNLRVVPDPASSTGWSLGRDPFPGWRSVTGR